MMLAVWYLLVPILSAFLVGLPVRGVLACGKALDESAWIQVPFVGVAVTILVLQFQLYLNVPINAGIWALWAIAASQWAIWAWHGRIKDSLRQVPMGAFAVALVVLAIQSLGLFRLGPEEYVGRSWSDQFNYTVMAEVFRNRGFVIRLEDIGQQAWLARLIQLNTLRIGQSVLLAYHGIITMMDTRSQFMPTMLLSFPLIALAIYAGARSLGLKRMPAVLAGFVAGLTPGVSMLAQESFLSHVWGIPFFLMAPTLLSAYNTDRSLTALGTAVLCLGTLASVYTEFLVLECVMVSGFLVLKLARPPRPAAIYCGYAVLLAAPWLCNPLYAGMTKFLTSSLLVRPNVLQAIYPWGYDAVGLGVVWFGDRCVERAEVAVAIRPYATLLGQIVVFTGAAGLALLTIMTAIISLRRKKTGTCDLSHKTRLEGTPQNNDRWNAFSNGGFDLRLALLGIALIPGAMVLYDQDHPYQYFKLLVTVSPLYALGLVALMAVAARLTGRLLGKRRVLRWMASAVIWLPVLVTAGIAAAGTGRMVLRSTETNRWFRTSQHVALSSDFRDLRLFLEEMHDQDILIRPAPKLQGYQQIWTMYFARQNRLWLAWPYHNDGYKTQTLSVPQLSGFGSLPPRFLVLSPRGTVYLQPPKTLPAPEIVWRNEAYVLWQYDGRPWACVTHLENPLGDDYHGGNNVWLGDEETVIELFASEAGLGRLRICVTPGPCLDPTDTVSLLISDRHSAPYVVESENGQMVVSLPLQRGKNSFTIRVLNSKRRAADPDPRPLLAVLQVGELEFKPSATPVFANFPNDGN